MKTNQIMIRENPAFIQRTRDGYFNATQLLNEWNTNNPNNQKQLAKYKDNKTTKEFIELLKKNGIEAPMISGRGSGQNAGTWIHSKIMVDLAMWVSVEFKSIVIDYVMDGLIFSRNEAGDYYKEMCASILEVYSEIYKKKPPINIYISEANLIKSLVTSKPRNEMTEHELSQITYLQKVNSNLILKKIGKESRIKRLVEANEINI